MSLSKLVASYATPNENGKGIDVNIAALVRNPEFLEEAVQAVLASVEKKPNTCVVVPSYMKAKKELGGLINRLAASTQIKSLVTGDVSNVEHLHHQPDHVILIKKSFRRGDKLREQVQKLQAVTGNVTVFCLITHSTGRMQGFAYETGAKVEALVKTDDEAYRSLYSLM